MINAAEQLDRRFADLNPYIPIATRPARGWIRAIRDGLGMTTGQLAKRIGVAQTRVSEMERAEISGSISLHNLERAAEAMGCRLVYTLVPMTPLTEMREARAAEIASDQLASVEQTMRLEDQSVTNKAQRKAAYQQLIDKLLRSPARLWDDA